ncbi:hypothetical protein DL240_18205 [Lujinxingia litoralis]|uniref:Peptidase C-terminal archaeal/bacterial domain-containing protein n=1 Tax=Lujinxingia litoralis TaxID=2211119 RepID=A0A328C4C1_9DELT|nr:hypothetical protein [Lujinxingia litoralis]RAL20152.1 hypothetical protein DL240_18205 [Lujinxingia litoralis]
MKRGRRALAGVGVMLLVLGVAAVGYAQGRDADGSRMQARQLAPGASHSDAISPPRDREDWFFVRVDEARELTFSLRAQRGEAKMTLELQGATGDRLGVSTTEGGKTALARRVNPGIYYVRVSGEGGRYELRVR